jgi:type II secretory pathway component PulF
VRLSFREKQNLYHSLGQLLRSGVTFPSALATLSRTSRGSLRKLLTQLDGAITGGLTVGEAFAAQRPAVSELEAGIVAAVEHAGRLDRGLTQLAEYFGALDAARSGVIRKIAYPVFVLHFGILVLGLPTLLTTGLGVYARETGFIFAVIYGVAIVIGLAVPVLRDFGATSAAMDSLLRLIPLVGAIRRDFAVARFCATYEMQLDASVNAMDGLAAAARASRSALIATAVKRALPEIRGGAQVGPLLAVSDAFPEAVMRSFSVGEQTGRLGEELGRMANEHQAAAITKLDLLAEWLPKLIYIAVCGYLGYRIVSWYGGYLQQVEDLTKQM